MISHGDTSHKIWKKFKYLQMLQILVAVAEIMEKSKAANDTKLSENMFTAFNWSLK